MSEISDLVDEFFGALRKKPASEKKVTYEEGVEMFLDVLPSAPARHGLNISPPPERFYSRTEVALGVRALLDRVYGREQ